MPALIDFHTPPLAEPTKTVTFPFSSTASTAAMRPLMAAEPIFLAVSPETVPASYFTGAGEGVCAVMVKARTKRTIIVPKNLCELKQILPAVIMVIGPLICKLLISICLWQQASAVHRRAF